MSAAAKSGEDRSCYNCNKVGHLSKNCPEPAVPRKAKTEKKKPDAGKGEAKPKPDSASATANASASVQMDYVRQVFCEPGSDGVAISDSAFKSGQPTTLRAIYRNGVAVAKAQAALGYMFRSCVAGDPVPNLVLRWTDVQPFVATPEADGTQPVAGQCFLVGESSMMIAAIPAAPTSGRLLGYRQMEGSVVRFVWCKETTKEDEAADIQKGWHRMGTKDELTMVALAALTGTKHGLTFYPANGVGKLTTSAKEVPKSIIACDIPLVDKMRSFFDKQDWAGMRYWATLASGPGASQYDPRLITSGDRVLKSGRLARSVMWNMVGWSAAALSRGMVAQVALGNSVDSSSAGEMGLFA